MDGYDWKISKIIKKNSRQTKRENGTEVRTTWKTEVVKILKCFDVLGFLSKISFIDYRNALWNMAFHWFIAIIVDLYMINPQNVQLEWTNKFTTDNPGISIVLKLQLLWLQGIDVSVFGWSDSRLIRLPILSIFALLSWILFKKIFDIDNLSC